MNAWITVHYPHPYDDSLPWRIYLREKELEQGRRVLRGDLVLFYLTESGPPSAWPGKVRIPGPSGVVEVAQDLRPQSTGGIVGVAVVDGSIIAKSDVTHDYGNSAEWQWYIPCRDFQRGRIVTKDDYKRIVGVGAPYRRGLSQFHHGDRALAAVMKALGVNGSSIAAAASPAVAVSSGPPVTHEHARREAALALARAGVRQVQYVMQRVVDVAGQTERSVEDAVKTFLLALGHEERRITFQSGRIDICVADEGGRMAMVVEVKRSLARQREDALRQGFDYAHRTSARLVVISDADHYEVYDLAKPGLGYEAKRVGAFQITRFSGADEAVLRVLRPER